MKSNEREEVLLSCRKELASKTLHDGSKEKYCNSCDQVFFHTPSPCVIVIVTNADNVSLARGIEWKRPYWGLISGHVRWAETAEEAAVQEVREEVGLKVTSLRFLRTYFTERQNPLMIAFKAETMETSIKKSQELEDARWFKSCDLLPMRPESTAAHVVKHVFPKIEYTKPEEKGKQS